MLYFAYGSNLDLDQMLEHVPGVRVVGLAALRDHRLTFPLYTGSWAGGTAGVSHAHGSTVWGVLYELSEADLAAFRGRELMNLHGGGNRRLSIPIQRARRVESRLVRPDAHPSR